jgi:processive 1,2-diacylglycerol beta-glucosyltransferase
MTLMTHRRWSVQPQSDLSRPRIVILSASVGSGHVRAAHAMEAALAQTLPDALIAHVDVLKLTNIMFRRAYGAGYLRAAQSAPHFLGWMYDFLDHPGDDGVTTRARLAFERFNLRRLRRLLTGQPWDLAINTHFLPTALIARLRENDVVNFPQVTVVTDFDVHGMWIQPRCEKFYVATAEARANAMASGLSADQVVVTGIPVDPRFGQGSRESARRCWGLAMDKPVVLQMAGGFGIGPIERIHELICQVEHPLQIVTVAGRNEAAKGAVEAMECPSRHERRVLGFTDQMHELLPAADVIVTKPGGLTSSECLASGCVMVIVEPIPGQEDRNADFLLENGCGIKVNNLASLPLKLAALLSDPAKLRRMRAAAFAHARPRAAFDIAADCVGLLRSCTRRED